jgi:hypothetical protein
VGSQPISQTQPFVIRTFSTHVFLSAAETSKSEVSAKSKDPYFHLKAAISAKDFSSTFENMKRRVAHSSRPLA